MHSHHRLFHALLSMFGKYNFKDIRHLKTLANMASGLIQSQSSCLTDWIPYSTSKAAIAQSTQRTFRRWLSNENINCRGIYSQIVKAWLSGIDDSRLFVALDTSVVHEEFCHIRFSLIFRGRAFPLIWKTIENPSASAAFEHYSHLFNELNEYIPKGKKVVLLADRAFGFVSLIEKCQELQWHFRIRIKKNHHVRLGKVYINKINDLYPISKGRWVLIHNVEFSDKLIGPVHLALAWPRGSKDKWAILSDEPTSRNTFEEYGKRFDIEEEFLDNKSGCFNWESSKLKNAEVMDKLVLVFAVTAVFLIQQGCEVVDIGKRREVDPHWFRGLSYMKIGMNWVNRVICNGGRLSSSIKSYSCFDPEPAKASNRREALVKKKRKRSLDEIGGLEDFGFAL